MMSGVQYYMKKKGDWVEGEFNLEKRADLESLWVRSLKNNITAISARVDYVFSMAKKNQFGNYSELKEKIEKAYIFKERIFHSIENMEKGSLEISQGTLKVGDELNYLFNEILSYFEREKISGSNQNSKSSIDELVCSMEKLAWDIELLIEMGDEFQELVDGMEFKE